MDIQIANKYFISFADHCTIFFSLGFSASSTHSLGLFIFPVMTQINLLTSTPVGMERLEKNEFLVPKGSAFQCEHVSWFDNRCFWSEYIQYMQPHCDCDGTLRPSSHRLYCVCIPFALALCHACVCSFTCTTFLMWR